MNVIESADEIRIALKDQARIVIAIFEGTFSTWQSRRHASITL